MPRRILWTPLLLAWTLCGCGPDRNRVDKKELIGIWYAVSIEADGVTKDEKAMLEEGRQLIVAFRGDEIQVITRDKRGNDTIREKGKFTLDAEKSPKQINLDLKNDKSHATEGMAIYELKGETLRICRPTTEGAAAPTRFSGGKGDQTILWVLKKERS